MGRTWRKRNRKLIFPGANFGVGDEIIALKKWMASHRWQNISHLKLRHFPNTGRGVCSSNSVPKGGVLIQVPFELMITFQTLANSPVMEILSPVSKLAFQSYLSVFLVLEKHHLERSVWRHYLESLPEVGPDLPWLCSDVEIESMPAGELRFSVEKARLKFLDSWEGVSKSIRTSWRCYHCGEKGDRVLNLNRFTWAYVMVNTRAVFVDPRIITGDLSETDSEKKNLENLLPLLSDEPCMALCPYLDMFNHSQFANTEASLEKIDRRKGCCWVFQLITTNSWRRNEQIFISYGGHDNIKLLVEYGFFLSGNELDRVAFTLPEVLECLDSRLDSRQYRFLRERNLANDLYIGLNGISFNLKAVLFVALRNDVRDWCGTIYSERYDDGDLDLMRKHRDELLKRKGVQCLEILRNLNSLENERTSDPFKLVIEFWKYWTLFVEDLLRMS